MQDHALRVGEELVLRGHIRLTVLAVRGDEAVLGITAPEPVEVGCPEVGCRPPSCARGRSLPPASRPWEG
jgi:hypothetical protein